MGPSGYGLAARDLSPDPAANGRTAARSPDAKMDALAGLRSKTASGEEDEDSDDGDDDEGRAEEGNGEEGDGEEEEEELRCLDERGGQ